CSPRRFAFGFARTSNGGARGCSTNESGVEQSRARADGAPADCRGVWALPGLSSLRDAVVALHSAFASRQPGLFRAEGAAEGKALPLPGPFFRAVLERRRRGVRPPSRRPAAE